MTSSVGLTSGSGQVAIVGGTIVDGTGGAPFKADVLIDDGRVAEIGTFNDLTVPRLDAGGLIVSPGFIDIHSHSDYTLLEDPRAVSAIFQGVTLEVVGNCGFGCFPIADASIAATAIYGYSGAVSPRWPSAGAYFDTLQEAQPAVNVASLVPHGQLRLRTIGVTSRGADADELRDMKRLLEASLDDGAWGFSTGLEYAWEGGASEAEVTTLCRPVAKRGALYATHTRDRDARALEAIDEALRTAAAADVRLQVSHIVPRGGEEQNERCIERVVRARDDGLDVAFDMHTRLHGFTYLHAALPAGALDGGPAKLRATLRDSSLREDLRGYRSLLSAGGDWERIVLLDNPVWPEYARRDFADIASERGQAPFDAVCDLLEGASEDTRRLMVIIRCYTESEQRLTFAHPLCVPGSDATTLAPDGPLAESFFHGAYSWAAWFYRFAVRDQHLLTSAEAIHKLTMQPADRLGLRDRGVLRAGAPADIAVFDHARFAETASTFDPNQLAAGMVHVFVNGVLTLENGMLTGQRAGQVLRRGEAT